MSLCSCLAFCTSCHDGRIVSYRIVCRVPYGLAAHVGHMLIRDALIVYPWDLDVEAAKTTTEHYEQILTSNWQTVRVKLPPPGTDIGWRVEVRPLENQLTDFEAAAFATFIMLLSDVIKVKKPNFYMPMSLVDENMLTARKRQAVRQEVFHFRNVWMTNGDDEAAEDEAPPLDDSVSARSLEDIFLGRTPEEKGLLDVVRDYALNEYECADHVRALIRLELQFLEDRLRGPMPYDGHVDSVFCARPCRLCWGLGHYTTHGA